MIPHIDAHHTTMISKISKCVFLWLLPFCFVFVANAFDIDTFATNALKNGQINPNAQSQIIEQENFIIAFVSLTNPLQDREAKLAHRGELYAKLAIFEHYQARDKKLQSLQISNALRSSIIKHNNKMYLALATNRANITKSYDESSEKNTREIYAQKAKMLESSLKQGDDDISTLKELARIYERLGEIEKYDEIQERILQKEFEF